MTLYRLNTGLAGVERAVAALMLGTIFAAVTTGVVSRYVFNLPIPWVEELSRFLFIWIGLLASCCAFAHREHMALGVLRFPARVQKKVQKIVAIARGVFLEALFIGMIAPSIRGAERYVLSNYLRFPESVVYMIVPLCFVLLAFHNAVQLIAEVREIAAGSRRKNAA